MPRLPRLAALLALVVLPLPAAVAATASPAAALSCVEPQRVRETASLVFTGQVVDTVDGQLEVAVEEVRRGELPPEIAVGSGSGSGSSSGATVRLTVEAEMYGLWPREDGELADGWRSERTWLFLPYEHEGRWLVNPCNSWLTSAGRSDGERGPGWERSGTASGGPFDAPAVLAGSAGAAVAAGGLAVWLVRRRRTQG